MTPDHASPDAPTRDDWPLTGPVIGVLVAVFLVLAILAGTIGTLPGDHWITEQLQRLHGQPWILLWHVGNAFGTSSWVVWIAIAGLLLTVAFRQWRDAAFIVFTMLLRTGASSLKGIIESPRPTASQAILHETYDGFGFPSGHTLTSTILFGTIAVLLVRHLPVRWAPRLAVGLWIVGVAMTGFARVWSGAHWTSDVLGGAILGTCLIAIATRLGWMAYDVMSRRVGAH